MGLQGGVFGVKVSRIHGKRILGHDAKLVDSDFQAIKLPRNQYIIQPFWICHLFYVSASCAPTVRDLPKHTEGRGK